MVKFVMATYFAKGNKNSNKAMEAINSAFSDTEKQVVVLDLESMNEDTLAKFIDMEAIDCFSFTPETLSSFKCKNVLARVLSVNSKRNKNIKFLNIFDGKDESSVHDAMGIGEVLLSHNCSATLSHMDIQSDPKIFMQNLHGIRNSAIRERAMLQEREQHIMDFISNVVDGIEKGKDEYTARHIRSVCAIAETIAGKLGLTSKDVDILKVGALLHDVGKQDVADSILKKPSRLTNDEFQEMKSHVLLGEVELNQYYLGEYERAKKIVAEHHEKYDGTGYPRGLKGDEIDILSRIVSLADATQAMFGRSYQSGRTKDELVSEIKRCSGTQFDPQMVDILCDVLEQDPQSIFVSYDEEGRIKYEVPTTEELIADVEERRAPKRNEYFGGEFNIE